MVETDDDTPTELEIDVGKGPRHSTRSTTIPTSRGVAGLASRKPTWVFLRFKHVPAEPLTGEKIVKLNTQASLEWGRAKDRRCRDLMPET